MSLTRSIFVVARAGFVACVPLWFGATVACSDDGGGGGAAGSGSGGAAGSDSGGAAGSATAGSTTSGSGGKSSAGGMPAEAGKSGGGSAGASGAGVGGGSGGSNGGGDGGGGGGGNVEPGEPCTANCPTGMVRRCFDDCPFGACDEGGFFADELCSTYYPSAISDDTIFCAKSQTATYCLTALDQLLEYYMVSCAAGTPTVTKCDGGCGVDANHVASCNE